MKRSPKFSLISVLGIMMYLANTTQGLLPLEKPRNILVDAFGVSGSQNLVMGRFAELLAERGHNVTILHSIINHDAKFPKTKKAKILSYVGVEKELTEELFAEVWDVPWHNETNGGMPPLGTLNKLLKAILVGCEKVAKPGAPIMEELNKTKWDVVVVHFVDFCSFGMAEVLGVKNTVWMSTAMMIEGMTMASGLPLGVSYVPSSFAHWGDDMTLIQRAINVVGTAGAYGMFRHVAADRYTDLFRKMYGEQFPHLWDVACNTQLYYINSDPLFEFPRPIQHNVIYVGGLTMEKPGQLDEEWTKLVESSGEGLVLFSLGTVANTTAMPLSYKQLFADAFAKFPEYTFLYRVEGEQPKKLPKNVKIVKWIPQKDLLAHPKVRAFITHGGYNSLTEATYLGVPLIVMPLFGDQYGNVARVTRAGVGVYLNKDNLQMDTITEAIRSVVKNEEIQSAADRLSLMMRTRPHQPLSTAIEWIEFLAEFGDLSMMRPISTTMPLYKYFNLDLVLVAITSISVTLYVIYVLCLASKRIFWDHIPQEKQKTQ